MCINGHDAAYENVALCHAGQNSAMADIDEAVSIYRIGQIDSGPLWTGPNKNGRIALSANPVVFA